MPVNRGESRIVRHSGEGWNSEHHQRLDQSPKEYESHNINGTSDVLVESEALFSFEAQAGLSDLRHGRSGCVLPKWAATWIHYGQAQNWRPVSLRPLGPRRQIH